MGGILGYTLIPITLINCTKEIPAQGRDDKLGGRDDNIFEIIFLHFAAHLAIPGLTRDLVCSPK